MFQSSSSSGNRACVLVVEDDRSSRTALMALLRLTGFDALPAGTVAEGIGLLGRDPDCVLLDLMLPDGDGSTILAHVRENNLHIPVAVTTGAVDWQARLAPASGPPDAVFQKPIDFKLLIEWIKSACTPKA